MKHVFIINPKAGRGRTNRAVQENIRAVCARRGVDFVLTHTEGPGDGVRLARWWAEREEPVRLYACGGDGTLNEVVQGAAGREQVAVTNVPTGTGNDFLKIFGPGYREGFSDLEALLEGPQSPLDLIDCNGHLGLGVVCAGVDARIADDVHRYDALPLVRGKGAYILSLIANVLFKGIAREMEVEMGGQRWQEPITLLCVCNGRYYGGGFMPVGEAMPDDGVLDALLVPRVGRGTLFRLVGAYGQGKYAQYPDLITPYHGPGPIVLRAEEPITLVADGETLKAREFVIRLAQRKVNFFYPPYLSWRPDGQTASPQPAAVGKID